MQEENKMVYDTNKTEGKEKKPRIDVEGKLIGISGNSEKMKIFSPKDGKFSWLQLSLVIGYEKSGEAIYKNVTAYKVNFNEMQELKRADELLKLKKHPKVKLQCYTTTVDAIDKVTGEPIMEETTAIKEGKEMIIQKQKKWVNYRMSDEDVKKTFKILEEDMDKERPQEDIQEIEM